MFFFFCVSTGSVSCCPTPTGMLSPAAAGIKAGLAALVAGDAESPNALPGAELRAMLGYPDYDAKAKRFIVGG